MVLSNDRGGGVLHLRVNGDWKREWAVSPAGFIRREEGKEERKVWGGVGPEVN